jgi:hypothetical protein
MVDHVKRVALGRGLVPRDLHADPFVSQAAPPAQ